MPTPQPSRDSASRRAVWLFALLSILIVAGVIAYGVYARRRAAAAVGARGEATAFADAERIDEVRRRPHLLFRITALGPAYGRVGIVPLDAPNASPVVTPLECDRVDATTEYGLCLQAARGVLTSYRAVSFDSRLAERHSFTLPGAPSRTRLAQAAPLAASTVFVSGDSYSAGGFSTRTTLYDVRANTVTGDLENTFTVLRDGQPFKRPDFNFWGVTFTPDGDRFYATLGTGGKLLLVEGALAGRTLTVIGADIECPSLSPDGTRIAYKSRLVEGGRVLWRLRILDLASRSTTAIAEQRNVDDQVEWLDDAQILYALPHAEAGSGSADIWVARADGTGTPRVLVADGLSPSVVPGR